MKLFLEKTRLLEIYGIADAGDTLHMTCLLGHHTAEQILLIQSRYRDQ